MYRPSFYFIDRNSQRVTRTEQIKKKAKSRELRYYTMRNIQKKSEEGATERAVHWLEFIFG